jgi:hypothetical protein
MKKLPLAAAFAAILALVSMTSCSPPAKESPAVDLVVNGNFAADAEGKVAGWETIRTPVPGSKPLGGFAGAPATALYIEDAGGVKQTLKGLQQDQTYRLTFRAWRRGGDWAPKPALTIGGIPLTMQREILPESPDNQPGRNLELYTIDQLVRPGAGDFELKIESVGDIVGLSRYSEVWLENVTFTPVEEKADLLNYPVETIAFRERALLRAGRPETIGLQLSNPVDAPITAKVKLIVPDGVKVLDAVEREVSEWTRRDIYAPFIQAYGVPRKLPEQSPSSTLTWRVEAEKPGDYVFQFEVAGERITPFTVKLDGTFEPPLSNVEKVTAVPPPVRADTGGIKVGAMFYPGWVPGSGWGWNLLDPYPNRKPALGYYDDTKIEVIDWQIKWALEHGISFFNVCWYRTTGTEGKPVEAWLNETLEQGLLKSSFIHQFEFALTWENHNCAGVSSLEDLLETLMPHWIENYFRHPSYLTFDGKPVFFLYSVDKFIEQLGGIANARAALEAMRKMCRDAGLNGLIIAGEDRNDNRTVVEKFRVSGLDATWSYGMQRVSDLRLRREWDLLPDIATISMGWDPRPWQEYIGYWWTSHYRRTPEEFRKVAEETLAIMKSWPEGSIARHIVQLDNWNEWAEGHFIAPSREGGFAYLEAVRQVFAPDSTKPANVLPEEIGLGPYEDSYERWLQSWKDILDRKSEESPGAGASD